MNKRTTTDFLIGVGLLAASPVAAWLIQKTVIQAVAIPDKPAIHEQIAMGNVANSTETHAAEIIAAHGADVDDMPSTTSDDVSEVVVGAND